MARRRRSERRPSTRRLKPKAPAPSSPWPNIEAFVEYDGNVSVGLLYPIGCAAVASDEHNMLAALVRRPGETFHQLLDRLDHAIDRGRQSRDLHRRNQWLIGRQYGHDRTLTVLEAIERFNSAIEATTAQLPDYVIFSSLPGAGPTFAPRLLAAFGEDRERYQRCEELQKYSGIAPVTERSGQKSWVHWRYRAPTFLRQTFVEWAGETIPRSFWAKAFYEQQRAKGLSHQAALRALAFKWIRILFRCWQDRTPYDEATYLLALQRSGSPLLKNLSTST